MAAMLALFQKLVSCSPTAMKAAMKGVAASEGAIKADDVELKPTPSTAETIGLGNGEVPPSKAGYFVWHVGGWNQPKFVSNAERPAPPPAAAPTPAAVPTPAPAPAVAVGQGTGEVPKSQADQFVSHVGGWSKPKFVSAAATPDTTTAPAATATATAAATAPAPPIAARPADGRRSEYLAYWAPSSFVDSALPSRKAFEESLQLPEGERCMLERAARQKSAAASVSPPPLPPPAATSAAVLADLD